MVLNQVSLILFLTNLLWNLYSYDKSLLLNICSRATRTPGLLDIPASQFIKKSLSILLTTKFSISFACLSWITLLEFPISNSFPSTSSNFRYNISDHFSLIFGNSESIDVMQIKTLLVLGSNSDILLLSNAPIILI